MAAIYTASTITIFLNVVGSYFWRLNDNVFVAGVIDEEDTLKYSNRLMF